MGLGRVPSNARQRMHTLAIAAAAAVATAAGVAVVAAAEIGGAEIDERACAPSYIKLNLPSMPRVGTPLQAQSPQQQQAQGPLGPRDVALDAS